MSSSLPVVGALSILLATVACAADEAKKPPSKPQQLHELTVRIVDRDRKPISGAHVGKSGEFWPKFFDPRVADASGLMYQYHCLSDKNGLARLESRDQDLAAPWGRVGVIARLGERGLIGFASVDPARAAQPVEITLVPECRVSGKVVCPELAKRGRNVGFLCVELSIDHLQVMDCRSELDGDFHLLAPPGRYALFGWGTYAPSPNLDQTLIIPSDKGEMELVLTVAPKKFALLMGRPAPELRDIAAWKNSPPLKLADLRGKCVLLEFWGHWCGPCVARMPQTFELYDRYAAQGLVVIGVHVEVTHEGVDSVEKLDAKLSRIRQQRWHGRDIPFPVALARPRLPGPSAAETDYEVGMYPSMILIDRSGNVVDLMNPNAGGRRLLEKALADRPTSNAKLGSVP